MMVERMKGSLGWLDLEAVICVLKTRTRTGHFRMSACRMRERHENRKLSQFIDHEHSWHMCVAFVSIDFG